MMKRWMAALIALLMVVACTAAFAEDVPADPEDEAVALFDSMWVGSAGEVRAFYMDGYWMVQITSTDRISEWNYICVYDAERRALVSDPNAENTKTEGTFDEEGSEINRVAVYTDGAAVFTLNEEGRLLWTDLREGAGTGAEFEKIGWYAGAYACGDYLLNIFWDTAASDDGEYYIGYKVDIEKTDSSGVTTWVYEIVIFSQEDGTLRAPAGEKMEQEKSGGPFITVYNDGSAVFTKDTEGNILWTDEKENAGEGLVFVLTNG